MAEIGDLTIMALGNIIVIFPRDSKFVVRVFLLQQQNSTMLSEQYCYKKSISK